MHNTLIKQGLALLAVVITGLAIAADSPRERIEKSLLNLSPDAKVDDVRPSPIDGISEVLIDSQLLYITDDGKYLFQGSLIDMQTRTDISEKRRKSIRLDAVNAIGADNMIIYPASEERHVVTVFTDIDCGYCRKLHQEMRAYNDNGITVRYLMYPRSGVDTQSYYKAVSVWCKKDRNAALTDSKAGKKLPKAECDNPVQAHMELGEQIGVRGTPALVLEDGAMMPGYVPALSLAKRLDALF